MVNYIRWDKIKVIIPSMLVHSMNIKILSSGAYLRYLKYLRKTKKSVTKQEPLKDSIAIYLL